jgi:hypothetical protein
MFQQNKEDPSDPYSMLSGGEPPDDYPDWHNPEDQEDAPEGYYDDEDEEDDGSYVPGPDDPDYDLSEAAGYAGWEAPERSSLLPQWIIVTGSIVLILAIVIPVLFALR